MASMVLWKERKKNAKRGFAAELMTEAGSRTGKKKIQSETWRFCPVPRRNEIFRDSCGLTRVVWSRGGAECASDALQDRWSLGELHGAQIPRKSATRSVGEEEEGGGGAGLLLQSKQARIRLRA